MEKNSVDFEVKTVKPAPEEPGSKKKHDSKEKEKSFDSEQIEKEIERTRSQIDLNLERLGRKLSPRHWAANAPLLSRYVDEKAWDQNTSALNPYERRKTWKRLAFLGVLGLLAYWGLQASAARKKPLKKKLKSSMLGNLRTLSTLAVAAKKGEPVVLILQPGK